MTTENAFLFLAPKEEKKMRSELFVDLIRLLPHFLAGLKLYAIGMSDSDTD
jgi:hypothetical protein